jgi:hypothetical protein
MNRPDREDAVARALDILPPGDPAASDPRLLRNPALLEEARAAREAAADVWLAVSPLRAAPPDVLHSVMDKIGLPPAVAPERRFPKLAPLLAASGWAAAAAIALCLWPRGQHLQDPGSVVIQESAHATKSGPREPDAPLVHNSIVGRETAPRQSEIERLRKRLAAFREIEASASPRIMSLTAPGVPRRTPEETNQRLSSALVAALKDTLALDSAITSDPASLVIQKGWPTKGMMEDGVPIRHLNFPENAWRDHQLLRADDGSYLDPVNQVVWVRENPTGSAFIGRKATEETDTAAYKPPDEDQTVAANDVRSEPEGFVIEDPITNQAEIVIDQVPEPAAGNHHQIIWHNASGQTGTIDVNSLSASTALSGSQLPYQASNFGTLSSNQASVIPISAAGMLLFTLPNAGGLTSFQLVETPIIPNGTPYRVIVQGGR